MAPLLPLPFGELLDTLELPELVEEVTPAGRGVGEVPRLDRSELAALGESVSVTTAGGAPAPVVLLLGWTSWPSVCGSMSMNARVGPATTVWPARSSTLPFSGWSSGVTKIATGPLMPGGTTHWLNGREMVSGAPPMSI